MSRMAVDVINVGQDPRVAQRQANLNGRTYSYLHALPPRGSIHATIFLIHGWPDISSAWRYQIPMLLSLGLQVVCPDMMGYGGTDAPRCPPESLSLYGHKRAADDIEALAAHIGVQNIILGGHDWGGAVVYKTALWKPKLVTAVFSVCTPYMKPRKALIPLPEIVNKAPQLAYQLHLAGPEVEASITTKTQIRQFLSGMYGGRSKQGEYMFDPKVGVSLENVSKMQQPPLLTKHELDFYTEQFSRNGLHGPLNWYRITEQNWKDELALESYKINVPVLFIQATKDTVLIPEMSKGMENDIPLLARREVDAGHWALWQAAAAVNDHVQDWLEKLSKIESKL